LCTSQELLPFHLQGDTHGTSKRKKASHNYIIPQSLYQSSTRIRRGAFGSRPSIWRVSSKLCCFRSQSSNRSLLHCSVGSSILLTATTRNDTLSVLANMACSLVWPPQSNLVSNSLCGISIRLKVVLPVVSLHRPRL
jgi:hypothetical protein